MLAHDVCEWRCITSILLKQKKLLYLCVIISTYFSASILYQTNNVSIAAERLIIMRHKKKRSMSTLVTSC